MQVLDAINDVEVTLVVEVGDVASFEPAVNEGLSVGVGAVPVAPDKAGAADL